jgi:hypothetical protein
MNKLARHFSKNLPKVVSKKQKDPYKDLLAELRSTLKADLVSRGWHYREINEGSVTKELELFKQDIDATLCIKAQPTKLDIDEEILEVENSVNRSKRIMEILQEKSALDKSVPVTQLLESAKKQVEEEEQTESNNDEEIEVAEVVKTTSKFALGVQPVGSPTALVLLCKSESGELTIENLYTSSERLPFPKYDRKPFLINAINSKYYIGPEFHFIDNYLQILMHEYLEKLGIDEQFILALELLSAGWEIKRLVENVGILDSVKSTKLIKV